MRRVPRFAILLLLATPFLAPAAPARAQAVRGVVVDAGTGSPLPGTTVILADTAGVELRRVETDGAGVFVLDVPAAGRWNVSTERVGYGPLSESTLMVPAGRALVLELRLVPLPLQLAPVVVEVESRRVSLEGVGFYERRDMGIGRFLTAEQIEQFAASQVTDVLRMDPSVRAHPVLSEGESNAYAISFRSQVRDFSGRFCFPTLVLDGTIVRRGGAPSIRLDALIHPAEIDGIELYPSGAGVPPRFGGMDARCGVILIWRKRYEDRPGAR
ncbi:MAG TPA: TonB-dependent receptor [Longimicrobiales bacterium]|nr:TonB-dependent receptor [Longimicrobiales bacterium]